MSSVFYRPAVSRTNAATRKWGATTSPIEIAVTGYCFFSFIDMPPDLERVIKETFGEGIFSIAGREAISGFLSGSGLSHDLLKNTLRLPIYLLKGLLNMVLGALGSVGRRIKDEINAYAHAGSGGYLGSAMTSNILSTLAVGINFNGADITRTDYNGISGIKFYIPTGLELPNSFTVRFLEPISTPVYKIAYSWLRLVRDYRLGIDGLSTNKPYAGNLVYWTTDPTLSTIGYACIFAGIYPVKDPSTTFAQDISQVETQYTEVEFNVDWMVISASSIYTASKENEKNVNSIQI